MRFIDLFAGLGGFHLALGRLGHECVFASEIDEDLADLYEQNFGMRPHGDIRSVRMADIPAHEILCAGCPCQPFSKAGEQHGLNCPKWGDLLEVVVKIARARQPKYLILENVPNLKRHNAGETWRELEELFVRAGYTMSSEYRSPHQFGIPQIRERVFIVGSRNGLQHFKWPEPLKRPKLSIRSILDDKPADARALPDDVVECLDAWQDFIERYPAKKDLPWFPIWTTEFGATYPFEKTTPWAMPRAELRRYRGSFGEPLKKRGRDDLFDGLPSYARTEEEQFPQWKQTFIRLNRELYRTHRAWIDKWLPKVKPMPASWQKFEWNCKGEKRDVWKYVIQFRASGVRMKRPTTAPSLIAMTTTQVPMIAWERRYMTPRECARLQSMNELVNLPSIQTRAFKALGNAVNADVVELIADALIQMPRAPRVHNRSRRVPRRVARERVVHAHA
jgi:DNA (cytosine-5)-methyltransferase 1